jgi:tRNA pseudouridine38-40 synthase
MRRLKLTLAYDGTAYHGWQIQPGLVTIQGVLEGCLGRITGCSVPVRGAGRTDAGVHALGQVASCEVDTRHDDAVLQRALNALLPADIAVRQVETAAAAFDARWSALGKTYRYTVFRRQVRSPFAPRTSLHVPVALDLAAMRTATACLVGTHDFSAFRAGTCGAASPIRTVTQAGWQVDGDWWHFEINGNAFLQHMVRIIVGTLLEVGRGRRKAEDVAAALAAGDRRQAGKTAPPQGLTLVEVAY